MELLRTVLLALVICKGVFGAVPVFTTPASGDATVSIAEAALGAAVETLTATDTDNGIVTFTFVSQTPTTSPVLFAVSSGTGAVTTTAALDYETEAERSFVVLFEAASNNAGTDTSTGTLTVSITDANDNTPAFSAVSASTACIASSSGTGTTVMTLTATDADGTALNSDISAYNIGAGDGSSQFDISAAGVVTRTAVALDATATDVYFLQIEAEDVGGANTGTTTLIVYLDDDAKCGGAIGLTGSLITSFIIFLIYQML